MSETVAKGPARQVLAAQCTLGEGPVWDAARQCLWFVDIKRHQVHSFALHSGAHEVHVLHDQVGWVLPAHGGKLLAGLKDGLYRFDPATDEARKLADVPGEPDGNRLNDACTDPAGRVWFGSMDDAESAPSGRFYCAHRNVVAAQGPEAVCITNGPAVSPDGRRIYFTDTLARRIMVADLDGEGRCGAPRLFADTAQHFPEAYPDGPVCDAQGCVWTGLWNGWGAARYSPDGELLEKVELPVANVTKLAFGGPDLTQAFVTTARKGLDAAALAAQPQAGDLFMFEVGVPGAPLALAEVWDGDAVC